MASHAWVKKEIALSYQHLLAFRLIDVLYVSVWIFQGTYATLPPLLPELPKRGSGSHLLSHIVSNIVPSAA